jgi:geranylgeranyl diphosphate synthase type II
VSLTLTDFAGVDAAEDVSSTIDAFFAEHIVRASALDENYRLLWEGARDACAGGKRFRPAFVIGTYRALGGTELANAVQVAAAFEILHTAFLLHDDVIDRDTVRRGRPNLVGAFAAEADLRGVEPREARLWGEASGILAGDLLIHATQGMIARLSVVDRIRDALLDLFDESVFVTAAGELADVAFATGVEEPQLAEVIAMSARKTADYSFASPLIAGGILADADGEVLEMLAEFGRLVGIAFQLRDDVLGVFGAERLTGKSVISDLRSGKVTPLIAYARNTEHWQELSHIMQKQQLTDADAEVVRGGLEQCGAKAFVEGLIVDHVARAVEIADASAIPAGLRERLRDAAWNATERVR